MDVCADVPCEWPLTCPKELRRSHAVIAAMAGERVLPPAPPSVPWEYTSLHISQKGPWVRDGGGLGRGLGSG